MGKANVFVDSRSVRILALASMFGLAACGGSSGGTGEGGAGGEAGKLSTGGAGGKGSGGLTGSGGVTCNSSLRARLEETCRQQGFLLRLADRSLCTDNAGIIGILAERKLQSGIKLTPNDAEVRAGWFLE